MMKKALENLRNKYENATSPHVLELEKKMRSLEKDVLDAKRSLIAAREVEENLKNDTNYHVLKKQLENNVSDAETRLRAANTEHRGLNLMIGLKMFLPSLAIRLTILSAFSSWFIFLLIGAILIIFTQSEYKKNLSYFCTVAIYVEILIISFKWLSFSTFLCAMILLIGSFLTDLLN